MAKKKTKAEFSKKIVAGIIVLNTVFSVAVFYCFLKTCSEPTALVGAWFSFTTVELWSLASIKKKKIQGECEDNDVDRIYN